MSSIVSQIDAIRHGSLTPVFGLLIDTAFKGSILILAAAIAVYLFRGRSAAARHAAWSAAVIGHLALPVLTLLVPQWRLPILPAPPWLDAQVVSPAVPNTIGAQIQPEQAVTPSSARAPVTSPPSSPSSSAGVADLATPVNAPVASTQPTRFSWPVISALGLFWILGAFLVLLRLAIGTWRVGKLAKHGDRVDDGEWLSLTQRVAKGLGITRPLTLLRGDSLAVPVTWGVVYPAVLLPPDSNEWPEARRRFVLVHEMAHVKRFDALTQLVAQITIAILWFDPFIWLAAHRMRVEREHACDDYVLRDGTVPSLYAGELLEMVQSIGSPRHESAAPAFAALAMARRSEFEGRMLAILDPRQDRHTLGRTSAMAASLALALLVLPLAALRPFSNPGLAASRAAVPPTNVGPANNSGTKANVRTISDKACDSVMETPRRSTSNSIHIHDDDEGGTRVLEYLAIAPDRCTQAVIVGEAVFANDRLLSLPAGAFASFRELTADRDRIVRVIPASGAALEYIATSDGKRVAYDDSMREWMGRFVPEVLREAAVDAPQRVARELDRGGVDLVLAHIGNLRSAASRRAHYEALLDGKPLTEAEYDRIGRHAARTMSDSPSDLSAILTRVAASPAAGTKSLRASVAKIARAQENMGTALETTLNRSRSSGDSARNLTAYATNTDDPEMIYLALRGAKDLSSDGDRRVLLQTIAASALGRNSARLRTAFFDAASAFTSDTDLRIVLQSALPYGHADPEVILAAFKAVGKQMTSDTDKRVTLSTALEQRLLSTPALREAFMTAARTIESSTDYGVLMQSALK